MLDMMSMSRPTRDVKTERIGFRVEPARKARWARAARQAGLSLSAWLGLVCDQAAAGRVTVEAAGASGAEATGKN